MPAGSHAYHSPWQVRTDALEESAAQPALPDAQQRPVAPPPDLVGPAPSTSPSTP